MGFNNVHFYTNRPQGILFPGEINYAYALLPVIEAAGRNTGNST